MYINEYTRCFKDILYGYAFFMPRDLEIHQKPISIFCEDDISKHSNIFCTTFFLCFFYKEKQKSSCHSRLWNWRYSGTIWALSVKEKSVKNKLFWAEISSWKLNDNGYFLSILFFRWTSIHVGIRCRKNKPYITEPIYIGVYTK